MASTFSCDTVHVNLVSSGLVVPVLQDMMEIGNPDDHASGDSFGVPGKRTNTLTLAEQTAHFSLWAALKSPLVIGVSIILLHSADSSLDRSSLQYDCNLTTSCQVV